MNKSTHDTQIELTIADLKQQMKPNVAATAKKYAVNESTLRKRWNGKTMSQSEASSEYKQRLTLAQEEVLATQINLLTDRGLPPTSSIVHNLAEEILEDRVSKNWTGDFVQRYKHELKSLYLQNLDQQRVKAEYGPLFKQFYDLVMFNYLNLLIFN
jgi:hypothetical protein